MTQAPFLRPLRLPSGIAGTLWLGPMPGRLRPFEDDLAALKTQGITRVVCLTPLAEIGEKALGYAAALAGDMEIPVARFPITDFGVPADETGLFALAGETANALAAGEQAFVHCAAGIGRTGTFAICILRALGLALDEATAQVAAAGSGPETEAQKALVARFALPAETTS